MNEQVKAFRQRPLQKTYPVIWVDALYEKIRYDRQVKNMAVQVVIGIDEQGRREVLAIEPCTKSLSLLTVNYLTIANLAV